MLRYTKKELKNLLLVILVLAFVFAFDDGRSTFEASYWLSNFIKTFFIVAIGLFVHDMGHDFIVRKQGFNSEFKYWGIKKLSLKREPSYPKTVKILGKKFELESFPIGILLAIFVTILSNGQLYWAAVSSYSLIRVKAHRLGRKFVEVTDFEEAKVAIAGPMAMLFLLLITKMFNSSGTLDHAVLIYSVIIVFDMLPLPGLDGYKVAMGSKPLYAFGFAFILSAVLMVQYMGAIFALLVAVLISFVVGSIYFYIGVFK